jgi:ABC-type multidrug transport system fused ATPase/permease subunit
MCVPACLTALTWCQVGIVGRTGSGKTTLLMALFRMINLAGGRIIMDGQDISALPLREVRRMFATRTLLLGLRHSSA